jgi:putative hemolysin
MDLNKLVGLIVALLLLGLIAGLEMAFIRANRMAVELRKKQGRKSGIILSGLMEEPYKMMGAFVIAFNLALIVHGLLLSEFSYPIWEVINVENPYIRLIVETGLTTMLVLLVVFLFRAMLRSRQDGFLVAVAPILKGIHDLFNPVAEFFKAIGDWVLVYIFNIRVDEDKQPFIRIDTEEFLEKAKEADQDSSELNTELFENALSLPSIRIRQCLVPRKEIEAVDTHINIQDLRNKFIDTKLSKLVVYDNNIDNITGYVHQIDLFKNPSTISEILKPIPAVPESMSATDLISKFNRERKSIAWVVDEFGGTAGIITMEDLLEEIFGEIRDEYDTEEFVEKEIAENEYVLSGRIELDYLNQKYDFDFPVDQSETLSGYIIHHHETIPKLKDRIIIGDFEFDILNVSDTRIEMVKMKKLK